MHKNDIKVKQQTEALLHHKMANIDWLTRLTSQTFYLYRKSDGRQAQNGVFFFLSIHLFQSIVFLEDL